LPAGGVFGLPATPPAGLLVGVGDEAGEVVGRSGFGRQGPGPLTGNNTCVRVSSGSLTVK